MTPPRRNAAVAGAVVLALTIAVPFVIDAANRPDRVPPTRDVVRGPGTRITPSDPSAPCRGVRVAPTSSLAIIDDGVGKTYCLSVGTYEVADTVSFDDGDVLVGAGATETFVVGVDGVLTIFDGKEGASWSVTYLDISGASGDLTCAPDCGRAFKGSGERLTIEHVVCHDNDNQCVGGGSADLSFSRNDCHRNGDERFVTYADVRSAACVKRVRGGDTDISTEIRDSYIHDNGWNGVWFDYYQGMAVVEGNLIEGNGNAGIGWEVSGGWNTRDALRVVDNTIRRNGHADAANAAAGVVCNGCADALVASNTFGDNGDGGAVAFIESSRGWGEISGFVLRDNTLGGGAVQCSVPGVVCSGNAA